MREDNKSIKDILGKSYDEWWDTIKDDLELEEFVGLYEQATDKQYQVTTKQPMGTEEEKATEMTDNLEEKDADAATENSLKDFLVPKAMKFSADIKRKKKEEEAAKKRKNKPDEDDKPPMSWGLWFCTWCCCCFMLCKGVCDWCPCASCCQLFPCCWEREKTPDEEREEVVDEKTQEIIDQFRELMGYEEKKPPNTIWQPMDIMNHKTQTRDPMGKLCIGMSIVPKTWTDSLPAGIGRTDPNMNPSLPPPTGRLKFSLNPFTMGSELCGPKLCAQITCCLTCVGFVSLMVFCSPVLNIVVMLLDKTVLA